MTDIYDPQDVVVDITAEEWYTTLDRNVVVPLFEDEDGEYIWGYGYIHPRQFAALVAVYDEYLTGGREYPKVKPKHVKYAWAVATKREDQLEFDEFRFNWRNVTKDDPHAFQITYVDRGDT